MQVSSGMSVNFSKNSHLRSADILGIECKHSKIVRTIDTNTPREKYYKIPHNLRSTRHFNYQGKLLLVIEFLTNNDPSNKMVICVGSYFPCLYKLFPLTDFLFVCSEVYRDTNIINDDFDPKLAAKIANNSKKDKIFISTSGLKDSFNSDQFKKIIGGMKIISPVISMIRFYLPWEKGLSVHYDGEIYFSVFGHQTDTLSWLVIKDISLRKVYDNTKYEEQMFYFNKVTRVQYYDNENTVNSDHCYDCACRTKIIKDYITKYKSEYTMEQLFRMLTN